MREDLSPENLFTGRNGVPLTPLSARPIVRWLLEKRPHWRRKDLAVEVERIHREHGGAMGPQPAIPVIKKTLQQLADENLVESVPNAFGLWRRLGATAEDGEPGALESTESASNDVDSDELKVLEEIGDGAEAVYLYYNPNDAKLAVFENRDEWECKIGKTQGSVITRVWEQGVKTALSHTPVVGLVIRTPDCTALERALHCSLRLLDKSIIDSPGTEWFLTSPARIKKWFEVFQNALKALS